jgi:acetylornithine deacetylase/succinyl-diaminopimelate desuccinylase-like protein
MRLSKLGIWTDRKKFDEGIAGIEKHFGTEFALLATAEKGYIDVSVTVETAGGHSSTPPDHTASKSPTDYASGYDLIDLQLDT